VLKKRLLTIEAEGRSTHDTHLSHRQQRRASAAVVTRLPQHPETVAAEAADHHASDAVGTDRTGLRPRAVRENDHDLTTQHAGEPPANASFVHGHVLDEDGRGVRIR